MKKSLICMCLLFLLSVGALTVVHSAVADTSDDVEIAEISHQGNPAVLQDLEITLHSQDDVHSLFWDTTLVPGSSIHTAFSITPPSVSPSTQDICDLTFYDISGIGGGTSSTQPIELSETEPLYPLYQATADRTRPGTTHTEIFTMADYFPDYPLSIHLSHPGFFGPQSLEEVEWLVANPQLSTSEEELEASKALLDFLGKLNDTFRIPTPADFRAAISVSKDSDGRIYHLNSTPDIPDTPPKDTPFAVSRGADVWDSPSVPVNSACLNPSSYSVDAGDSIYFCLEARRSDDEALLDYSKTPGYGLYRLRLTEQIPSMDQLELVLPLEADQKIRHLMTDPSGQRVLFTTSTDKEDLLYILDSATGELRQTLYTDHEGQDVYPIYRTDDSVLLIIAARAQHSSFRLFHQEENGDYAEQFTGQLLAQDSPYYQGYWDNTRMLFAGQRLFLASSANRCRSGEEPQCRLLLQVWDASGLLYAGLWDSSLNRSPGRSGRYTIGPNPFSEVPPLTIRLKNP